MQGPNAGNLTDAWSSQTKARPNRPPRAALPRGPSQRLITGNTASLSNAGPPTRCTLLHNSQVPQNPIRRVSSIGSLCGSQWQTHICQKSHFCLKGHVFIISSEGCQMLGNDRLSLFICDSVRQVPKSALTIVSVSFRLKMEFLEESCCLGLQVQGLRQCLRPCHQHGLVCSRKGPVLSHTQCEKDVNLRGELLTAPSRALLSVTGIFPAGAWE